MYGWPKKEEKVHTLSLLMKLHEEVNEEWFYIGDFNIVIDPLDKEGGVGIDWHMLSEFRETVLGRCDLNEVTFKENKFT